MDKGTRKIVSNLKLRFNMKKIFKFTALAAVVALALSACTKDFEKINTDPDAYATAPVTNMLGYCIEQMSVNWGDELTRLSDWMGYTCLGYDAERFNYLPTNNEFGNKWYQTYTLYPQLQDIINRTDPAEAKNIQNVAKVLQNFMLLLTVDSFGDIPYSEAFQGVNGGNIKPVFDKDEDVYNALIENFKAIADSWADGLGDDDLGEGDFLFGGDVAGWQRFCNSLRLRIAMRLSGMSSQASKSKATFEEILGNPAKYPVIDESAENCEFWWDGSSSYRERWYNNWLSRPNDYQMSEVFIRRMKQQDDPRLPVFALPAENSGEYVGLLHGCQVNYNGKSAADFSYPGDLYYNNPAGSSPYFRAAETWFLIAEAAVKGWNVGYTAEQAYNNGVTCSFEDNQIPAQAADYLAAKGKFDASKALDCIYNELWVGLYKQGQEAWALYRRTGYPTTLREPVTYSTGTTCAQYPGEKKTYADCDDLPYRFPYPDNEFAYNGDNTNAASVGIVHYCYGKKLCWAK